jgi:aconitate hydratase
MQKLNSFGARTEMGIDGETFQIYSLRALARAGFAGVERLPYSLKILLENLLRSEDGRFVKAQDIETLAGWDPKAGRQKEIAFAPARVLLQDFTGVPAVLDLAAMRDAMDRLGGDPDRVNPLLPVDLVIDHSVQVDHHGTPRAFHLNADLEYQRNRERYTFLRWGQNAFRNLRVVPPETGIVHQVNLEYLAQVVFTARENGERLAYPDTLVGTDSHTTMVNGLGVVGWGVGGIEAEAAMLGLPISMLIPEVLGFKLVGRLPEGSTATDMVLTIAETLRRHGVVGKFVEFYGPGLESLTIADRATLGNMSPEYGATIAIFPIDEMTLDYLRLTGRDEAHVRLVEHYARAQGLFREPGAPEAVYAETLELDLASIEPCLAGPRRPHDRVSLGDVGLKFEQALGGMLAKPAKTGSGGSAVAVSSEKAGVAVVERAAEGLDHGSVVIAAITSCTNTSNPGVMIGAGLLAKKAAERGLRPKPWVKTSLAPGSQVVTEYLRDAGLLSSLEDMGFHLVGYGCTTCIGNSGPLPEEVASAVKERSLVVASILSGNRNFEGRIQSLVRANYLASPPLVVAYALAGRITIDMTTDPVGHDPDGQPVYLRDIWPRESEIQSAMLASVKAEMFKKVYGRVFEGDERWRSLPAPEGTRFQWDGSSTYIQDPPFFADIKVKPEPLSDILGARVLALLGDSVTTDHISPAGSIQPDSPAGKYLIERGVPPAEFNAYGARRGNHEVMMRGTFANIRLRNGLVPGVEGGYTVHLPGDEVLSIYDAAMRYKSAGIPLVVLAGKEYGSGSSRDWAAKGTALLGVRAVVAESFERIHRSNLVNMGVLPLQFLPGESVEQLGLSGRELFNITGVESSLEPRGRVTVRAVAPDATERTFQTLVRIDTPEELVAFSHGGILPYVLRKLLRPSEPTSI